MDEQQATRPQWPRLAASAAIFREDRVLIGQRGKGAMSGLWSLPGGHVEPGETARAAASREVAEETGVVADILGLVDLHEVIQREGAQDSPLQVVSWHYVIAVHYGLWRSGEPVPADDCRDARFVALSELDAFEMTTGAKLLIQRAASLVIEHGANRRSS